MKKFFEAIGKGIGALFIGVFWIVRFVLGLVGLILVLALYLIIKLVILLYRLLARFVAWLFPAFVNILSKLG